jgi:hypothetical protein
VVLETFCSKAAPVNPIAASSHWKDIFDTHRCCWNDSSLMSANKSIAETIFSADELASAFFRNNDASSYNMRYLKSIRNKERFQELHWFQCSVDLLNELFPHKPGKGTLDPPPTYRQSAVTLAEWRNLDEAKQKALVDKEEGERKERGEQVTPMVPNSNAETVAGNPELKRNVDAATDNQSIAPAPAAKMPRADPASTVTSSASSNAAADPNPDSSLDISYSWDPFQMEMNTDFLAGRTCQGLTFDFLEENFPDEEAKLRGFSIVAGDAMNYKAQVYSNNQSWPFASDPRVVGAIVEQMTTENAKVFIALKWICVILPEGKNVTIMNSNKMDAIHFYHPLCDRSAAAGWMCQKCKAHAIPLLNLCGAAVEKHAIMSTHLS